MAKQRWIEIGVVAGIILLMLALLLPAVQNAREEARKSTAKNNLKQIGLAFHNYHQTHGCLPPGGIIREEGTAMQGWPAMLMPFSEASPYYSMIDFNVPWNKLENQEIFEQTRPWYMIPGVDANYTSTGYGLTHYLGNPNLLSRNSCATFGQMEKGLVNNWLVGEVAGNYQPWGYPFNWRSLGTKLCDGPASFGYPVWNGGHLVLADGRVSFFSDETSPEILKSFANVPPVVSEEQKEVPKNIFETDGFQWKDVTLPSDQENKNDYYARVLRNTTNRPLRIKVYTVINFTRNEEENVGQAKKTYMPHLLFRINSTTDIATALKATSLSDATTPGQFQSNVKTLQALQKRLPKKDSAR